MTQLGVSSRLGGLHHMTCAGTDGTDGCPMIIYQGRLQLVVPTDGAKSDKSAPLKHRNIAEKPELVTGPNAFLINCGKNHI